MAKNKIRVQLDGNRFADITVAPNQKVIKTEKVLERGYILDITSNKIAAKNLSAQAYVLYMHFILNKPGYTEALSLKYIMETTSLSERQYYKAINELIDKSYLVKTNHPDFKEYYILYENPNEEL